MDVKTQHRNKSNEPQDFKPMTSYYINQYGLIDVEKQQNVEKAKTRQTRFATIIQGIVDRSSLASNRQSQKINSRKSTLPVKIKDQWRYVPIDKLANISRAGQTVKLATPQLGTKLYQPDAKTQAQFDFLKQKQYRKLMNQPLEESPSKQSVGVSPSKQPAQRSPSKHPTVIEPSLENDELQNLIEETKKENKLENIPSNKVLWEIDPDLDENPYRDDYDIKAKRKQIYNKYGELVKEIPLFRVRRLSNRGSSTQLFEANEFRRNELPSEGIQKYLSKFKKQRRSRSTVRIRNLSIPKMNKTPEPKTQREADKFLEPIPASSNEKQHRKTIQWISKSKSVSNKHGNGQNRLSKLGRVSSLSVAKSAVGNLMRNYYFQNPMLKVEDQELQTRIDLRQFHQAAL